MTIPEEWTQAQAEGYAAHYASMHGELLALQRQDKFIGDQLRRYMELNDLSDLVDGETGLGVELGPPPTKTEWDTRSMPDATLLSLKARGVLQIVTSAFDALRKVGGGPDLDDAMRFRMTGEGTRPLKVKDDV